MSADTPEMTALRRAADLLGGQAALAAACGFSDRRNVYPWFSLGRKVPAEHCPAIEKATGGAVRCEDLRPDVSWEVLREQRKSSKPFRGRAPEEKAEA